jgi:hypothetical protein
MTLDALIARLESISPSAVVGRGPFHSIDPNLLLKEPTERWLALHPFLQRDVGYVAFLKRYSGFLLSDDHANLEIGIQGLSGIGGYLTEVELGVQNDTVAHVDESGFYPFASLYFHGSPAREFEDYVGFGFSFDATGQRPWGIYRTVETQRGRRVIEHFYCDSFVSFLKKLPCEEDRSDWV